MLDPIRYLCWVVAQFGFNDAALSGLKHKVLRSYSQAEENACSFTDLRMTNRVVGAIDFRLPHYPLLRPVVGGAQLSLNW
jgi:hypothetical protein